MKAGWVPCCCLPSSHDFFANNKESCCRIDVMVIVHLINASCECDEKHFKSLSMRDLEREV